MIPRHFSSSGKISRGIARMEMEILSTGRFFTKSHGNTAMVSSRGRVACINKSAVRAAGGGIACCNPGARRFVRRETALSLPPWKINTPRRNKPRSCVCVRPRQSGVAGLNCTARFYFRRVLVPRFGFSLSRALPSLRHAHTHVHILHSLSLSLRICLEF